VINPEEDIKCIKIDLQRLKVDYATGLEHISFQEDMADAVQSFWRPHAHTDDSFGSALVSGAAVINSWRRQLDELVMASPSQLEQVYAASSTATNVGGITGTLAQYSSPITNFEISKITQVTEKRLYRKRIEEALRSIDPNLADTYASVSQLQAYPVSDPGRGPLGQMRQVFDHFLDKLAPHDKVRAYLDSLTATTSRSETARATPRKRKRRKVSFKTKIEYFAQTQVSDKNLANAVLESTKTFDSVYSSLIRIHTPAKLGEEKTKKALIQAETLLQLWLLAIGKMPHD